MRRSGNKVLVIVLVIIALLVITGGAFAYLYFCTDMFRTGQELFAKYLTQNIEEINQTTTLKKVEEIESKLKQNKYEENLTISYTEADKTEPAGQITIDTQNDPISEKYYGNIALSNPALGEPLKIEYMKESYMYSLLFTNSVKQFLTLQNTDLKEFATNLGVDEETIEQIPDTIDFEKYSLEKLNLTEEEKNAEIKKYSELLYNNIAKEKYTKSKDTVITVNAKTITTNAYILKLNDQDLENLTIKLLETLKQDEIILAKLQIVDEILQDYTEESLKESFVEAIQEKIDETKQGETDESEQEEAKQEQNVVITVYEAKGKTVRIKLEQGLEYITLDTTEVEGKKQINMKYTSIDKENTQLSNEITFIKESNNKLSVKFNNIDGEEQQSNEINMEIVENENDIKLEVILDDDEAQILITRKIEILEEIDYKVTLNNTNDIVLNNLEKEKIITVLNAVGQKVNTEYIEPLETMLLPILLGGGIYDTEMESTEIQIPENDMVDEETENIADNTSEGNDSSTENAQNPTGNTNTENAGENITNALN